MKRHIPRTLALACLLYAAGRLPAAPDADTIRNATGVQGGVMVIVGCGDGTLPASLGAAGGCLVQALDRDPAAVARAGRAIRAKGLYGRVTAHHLDGAHLPYVDNFVNLVIMENAGNIPIREVMRVLRPGGVAYVKRDGNWKAETKARPDTIDDWTHYMHDAGGNAVAHDSVVGPPRHLQWVGGPRYARHHDRLSSVNALVSSGGRVFTIFDEAPRFSVLPKARWKLIARDAFNGTILWKRDIPAWHTHLWPLKSGPAQLPRRLVAAGGRVYVTLGLDAPLTALDAATGKTLRVYEGTRATEEILHLDGTLYLLVNDAADKADYDGSKNFAKGYGLKVWNEEPRNLMAIDAASGTVKWTSRRRALPMTLATDGRRVVFHDGKAVVGLNAAGGKETWRSESLARVDVIRGFYAPTLVLTDGVVLFSGGETAGNQTGSWYEKGKDTLAALDAATGKTLWSAQHPPSGYRSPEDVLVVDGLVWSGQTTSGRAKGVFTGRDLRTGEIKSEFPPDVETYWFHHRCYRGKATDKYLLMSRAGIEFIDVKEKHWTPNHWVRGACLYGIMPANGLVYAPQHPCACYLESKLDGFNALAATRSTPASPGPRLTRGPAYGDAGTAATTPAPTDWPTFRGNAARSGQATTRVAPEGLSRAWTTPLGGRLSTVVIAGGRLYVAAVDDHTVHALNAATGRKLWQFTAGGRIDSPPTIHGERVLFGSRDGHVYALRASDGVLAWRLRAGPADLQTQSFEQLESVWPVHGSVLVRDNVLYCVAGRSMFLDGGLRLLRVRPTTGELLSETVLDEHEAGSGKDVQDYVSWLNMPPALPDVLSSDGRHIYMRSQPFRTDGTRLPLEAMPTSGDADAGAPPATQNPELTHLFSPTGFLDDSWWHRTYWLHGSRFVSGWCGYYRAGKATPAGRIMVHDDETVYGFGRKPKYYRWTTPIEHHLYASRIAPTAAVQANEPPARETRVSVARSKSLDPTGSPLTVEAWIHPEKPNGVILAHGGGALGYVLYLENGRVHFALRSDGKLSKAAGKRKIGNEWTHVAGTCALDGTLVVYVNGKRDGAGRAPNLVQANPSDGMQLGCDEDTNVGDYPDRFAFNGRIDEVRVYHRALAAAELAARAAGDAPTDDTARVLCFDFNDGKALDRSGSGNDGTIEGTGLAGGKFGRALTFSGKSSSASGLDYAHQWTLDLPLLARAMVLSDQTIFVAGPEDVVDEDQAMRRIHDPEIAALLDKQTASYEGKHGALLWAVNTADGTRAANVALSSPPVFDGMAAANGRLFIAGMDGTVTCLK